MPFVDHDNQLFRVGAEEWYSDSGNILGYQPWFSTVVTVPPGEAGTATDTSTTRYVPGPQLANRTEAIKIAIDTLKLNWEAQKASRQLALSDKVGDIKTLRVGKIAQGPMYACGGISHVAFDSGVEQVSISQLIFLV